jgi:flavodoxin
MTKIAGARVQSAMADARSLILCKSVHHGNTARVAAAIAAVLGAEIASPEDVPYTSLPRRELVGFGSGVFYGRMHPALFDWLAGLPDASEPIMPAFVFSTSGLPCLAKLWHGPLVRLLARKGFDVRGAFACRGFDTWGPLWLAGGLNRDHPDAADLERAAAFARRIAPQAVAAAS